MGDVIKKAEAITLEDAERVLEEERKHRAAECRRDIGIALRAHRCKLVPYAVIREGKIVQGFEVVADG